MLPRPTHRCTIGCLRSIIETVRIWSIDGATDLDCADFFWFFHLHYLGLLMIQIHFRSAFRWFISMVSFGLWHSVSSTVNISAGISHSTTNYEHDIGFQWAGTLAHDHKSLHLFMSMLGDLRHRPWETWLRSQEQSTTLWIGLVLF